MLTGSCLCVFSGKLEKSGNESELSTDYICIYD